MLLSLLDIYNNKPGVLAKQYQSISMPNQRRKGSVSSYKRECQEKEIKKENQGLFQSLVNAEPSVGNKKEWEKHYEQHKQMQKKLMHQNQNREIFNLKDFRGSFTRQKQRKLSKLDKKEQKLMQLSCEDRHQHESTISKKKKRKKTEKKAEDELEKQEVKVELMDTVPA